jgi:RAD51-like protein 3
MVSMGAILRKLAIENHLAVLPKPALGESWKRIPDVRLLLTHDPSSNACEVAVIKHSSIVSPPSNFSMFVLFS